MRPFLYLLAMEETVNTITEIVGLSMGEETKGAWTEFAVFQTHAKYVWRKGGPQSGHHVVINDHTEMMLSHFGAGVFQGVITYVDMPIIPVELFIESQELKAKGIKNPLDLIVVNASCLVVTPFHQAMSRLLELTRKNKKGTIGLGVGLAIKKNNTNRSLSIRAFDLRLTTAYIEKKVEAVRVHLLEEAREIIKNLPTPINEEIMTEFDLLDNQNLVSEIAEAYSLFSDLVKLGDETFFVEMIKHDVVIETSHGALLHPRHGFVPHITQIDPTGQDALSRLNCHSFNGELIRLGVFRCYGTRFGAGPFVSFDEEMTGTIREHHHTDDPWLGRFRKGYLDMVSLSYAMKVCGEPELDGLMISFFDLLEGKSEWKICEAYEYLGEKTDLDNYFEMDGDRITGIKLLSDDGTTAHLQHQEELTKLLFDCIPVLTTISSTDSKSLGEMLIEKIENGLGLPVVATACGPKMSDRSLRKSLWR